MRRCWASGDRGRKRQEEIGRIERKKENTPIIRRPANPREGRLFKWEMKTFDAIPMHSNLASFMRSLRLNSFLLSTH